MKTKKNILGILLTLVAMITFCSCGEEDAKYTPAEKLNSAQVYFPVTDSTSINLSSTANSFDITIARIKTDDALTVPLTATGTDGLYTVPSSVTFSQGASTATITVTYNPEEVGFDKFSELTLKIGDEDYTTVYGLSEYKFEVGIPSPWETLGSATFVEDFLTTFYGVENTPYNVEIQENQLQPGFFRLVNPFGADYAYNDPGDWDDSKNWYLEIHAEDPTAVYMYMQETGMSWSYGMFSVGSLAGYYMSKGKTLEEVKAAGYTGTYEDGIITFPTNSMLISMANYNDGGLYKANSNGAFRVAMPGVVLADYSVDVSYAGKYMGTNDKVTGVLAKINSVGEDVESIRLAVVEGTDVDAAIEGIRSGNIDFTEVAASPATVLIPFSGEPTEGHYTIVAVSYADNKAQKASSAEFKYTPPTSETWTAHSTGDYAYTLFFGSEEEPAVDSGLVLYQSDSNSNRWKIEHWGQDVDFIFTYNQETGDVMVEEQETGYTDSSDGTVYVDDLVDYTGGANYGKSYYADGVFHFAVVYYVSGGVYAYGEETFTLKESTATKTRAILSNHSASKKMKVVPTISRTKMMRRNLSDYFWGSN